MESLTYKLININDLVNIAFTLNRDAATMTFTLPGVTHAQGYVLGADTGAGNIQSINGIRTNLTIRGAGTTTVTNTANTITISSPAPLSADQYVADFAGLRDAITIVGNGVGVTTNTATGAIVITAQQSLGTASIGNINITDTTISSNLQGRSLDLVSPRSGVNTIAAAGLLIRGNIITAPNATIDLSPGRVQLGTTANIRLQSGTDSAGIGKFNNGALGWVYSVARAARANTAVSAEKTLAATTVLSAATATTIANNTLGGITANGANLNSSASTLTFTTTALNIDLANIKFNQLTANRLLARGTGSGLQTVEDIAATSQIDSVFVTQTGTTAVDLKVGQIALVQHYIELGNTTNRPLVPGEVLVYDGTSVNGLANQHLLLYAMTTTGARWATQVPAGTYRVLGSGLAFRERLVQRIA